MKTIPAIFLLVTSLSANAATVTVTQDSSTAAFQIVFDHAPDFFTVDAYDRQPDSFQFYTPGTVIRGDEIHVGNTIVIRNVFYGPYTDPHSGGWGSVRGAVPYSLTDNVLEFVVPFSMLDSHDQFPWQIYRYGRTVEMSAPTVPLPGALVLFASGLVALVLFKTRLKNS